MQHVTTVAFYIFDMLVSHRSRISNSYRNRFLNVLEDCTNVLFTLHNVQFLPNERLNRVQSFLDCPDPQLCRL
jgi:hypothetical protein